MSNISKINLNGDTYNIQDTVSGYTTNTGTVTGVKVNGSTKSPSSGVVDIGTVATSDTKNTAGSTDTSSKIFLIGATSQAANPQTYSQDTAYVGTDGCLYSNSTKVVTTSDVGTAAAKAYTTSVTSGSGDLVTSGAVYTAIENLPEPMIFKGTLGTGGTITTLPTAAAANEGFTYKVITAGTYASTAAKVGDVFVSNGSSWVLIPSGDDTTTDTWRNIKVNGTEKLGTGISTGAVDFVNGTNTTVSFNSTGNKVSINATDTKYTANTTSIGSASAGTAISADDITAWSAGTLPSLTTETVKPLMGITEGMGSPTTATISKGVLTITKGDDPVIAIGSVTPADGYKVVSTWSAGTAPSLSYTSRSIPNISVTATTVATGITES